MPPPETVNTIIDTEIIRRDYSDRIERISAGQYFIREGDADSRVFVLVSGIARIVRTSADGAQTIVASVQAPALLGEMAPFMPDHRRTASVYAEENSCEVVMFNQREFLTLLTGNADVAMYLIETLAERLHETTGRTADREERLQNVEALLQRLLSLQAVSGAIHMEFERLVDEVNRYLSDHGETAPPRLPKGHEA